MGSIGFVVGKVLNSKYFTHRTLRHQTCEFKLEFVRIDLFAAQNGAKCKQMAVERAVRFGTRIAATLCDCVAADYRQVTNNWDRPANARLRACCERNQYRGEILVGTNDPVILLIERCRK
jgi:hypothetical protein